MYKGYVFDVFIILQYTLCAATPITREIDYSYFFRYFFRYFKSKLFQKNFK